ncbi:MAG: hypothetical protein QXG32_00710 [Candidatus Bathyarchaeia archaeon]
MSKNAEDRAIHISLTVRPMLGSCSGFRGRPEEAPSRHSIVFAPMKVMHFLAEKDGVPSEGFSWSCSAGPFCQSPLCRYSAYNKPK